MIIVHATILNVAIPSIARDLGVIIMQAGWANSIYALVFATLLITVGRSNAATERSSPPSIAHPHSSRW